MQWIKRAITALAVFLLALAPAYAQVTLAPSASLAGDDPDGSPTFFGDGYGAGAAAWGDWLFVGNPRETAFRDGEDRQDGAVYIFREVAGAYVFQQKLTMDGSAVGGDRFGAGIEAEAGWLFIGAANDQDFPAGTPDDPNDGLFPDPYTFAGQVHVYELNRKTDTWELNTTLISPEPTSSGSFGARTQASHIALSPSGKVALIGEANNFAGGIGEVHSFAQKKGTWEWVETIVSPDPDLDDFADEVVHIGGKDWLIGGFDLTGSLEGRGFVYVFRSMKNDGKFDPVPIQAIAGPTYDFVTCPLLNDTFGGAGIAAGNGVVAIADGCFSGIGKPGSGAVSVYRVVDGPAPLAFETIIEGDEPGLFLGSNLQGSRHAVAVSDSGNRILAGAPLSPFGFFDPNTAGADVRVYAFDGAAWTNESKLMTPTPASADFRSFGDAVFFLDDETAFVREGNFIDPVVTGLKSQGLIFDLTP